MRAAPPSASRPAASRPDRPGAAVPRAPEADEPAPRRATTGRSVLHGGLWYVASYAIPQVYTLVVSIVAARFLGPHGMGRQSFIAFVSLATDDLLSSSIYVALMRYIGESVGRGRRRAAARPARAGRGGSRASAAVAERRRSRSWPRLRRRSRAARGCSPAVVCRGRDPAHRPDRGPDRPAAVPAGADRSASTTGLVGTVAVVARALAGRRDHRDVRGRGRDRRRQPRLDGRARPAGACGAPRRRTPTPRHARPAPRVGRFALLSSVGLVLELIVGTRSEFFFLAHFSTDAADRLLLDRVLGGDGAAADPAGARGLDGARLRHALRRGRDGPDPLRLLALAAAAHARRRCR